MKDKINFLLVDDHPIMREGLTALIECRDTYHVRAQAGSINQARVLLESNTFEFAIIDLSMPDGNGLGLVKYIRDHYSHIFILVMSVMDENYYAERSIKAGANGYIMKGAPSEQVLVAIDQVLSGRIYLSEVLVEALLSRAVDRRRGAEFISVDKLDDQEFEIFQLIGMGLEPRQIANRMALSSRSVEVCKRRLKNKLMLKRAVELRQYAIAWISQSMGTVN
ncbi:MAG: response regulator transcription factor [Spirochaetales bacterium]|nr:response regulator transcription factor [Spirochaetales bacterium]